MSPITKFSDQWLLRYWSQKITMPMKMVQFWSKNSITHDFLSHMQVSCITSFVLVNYIDCHPKQYQFNHFHPFLIGSSWWKRVRTWKWCNWSVFPLFTNSGSRNLLETVSKWSDIVFSSILDDWFLLMKKSPKLKLMRLTWFSSNKLIFGREIDWKCFQNDPT